MRTKKENLTYEGAMARLEELARRMESDETGMDELAEELREARRLMDFCREKLYATDEEIRKALEADTEKSDALK